MHSILSSMRRRFWLGALLALGSSAVTVGAQTGTWPNKPIRIVVAFPPGGLTDAYARMYAEQLTAKLGVPAVVENKPGAGAIIGIDTVAKSAPPYNLDKDLVPIAVFPSGPLVAGVPEKLPVTNMKEFIQYAKQNPTTMGTYAPGSYPHMVADQVNRNDGTKILSVHYRGETSMWVDLVSGQTQIAIGSYQAFATVQGRGVRPIGVTGPYRSPKLPDVPTLLEQGIDPKLMSLEGGLPLMAPAGTPEPILQALSQIAVEGANTQRAAQLREAFAIPNKPKNLEGTRADWVRDVPTWIKMAVDLGIKLD
jgi:tripartite-type tricarboxylate transporter receptor subunit TctC